MTFPAWREPTPPIVHQPDAVDEPNFNWYYNESAGGHVLDFGKHHGQTMRATSISYLYFCRNRFQGIENKYRHHVTFLAAFEEFHTGLRAYAASSPGEFRVPFGRKHQGERINEVNDPEWMLWTQKQSVLTNKYPVFFEAMRHFVDNTHDQGLHQGVPQPPTEPPEPPSESRPANPDSRSEQNVHAGHAADNSAVTLDPRSEQNVHAGHVADDSAVDKVPVPATPPQTPKRQHSSLSDDNELPAQGILLPQSSTGFMPETPVKQKRDLSSSDMLPPANRSRIGGACPETPSKRPRRTVLAKELVSPLCVAEERRAELLTCQLHHLCKVFIAERPAPPSLGHKHYVSRPPIGGSG
ncbi:hypothetical protein DXG01_016007 [Tephrocybe rancida]|nr:hypothetical protein DXG01_016007 [Tephrocybe rancida]